MQPKPFVLWVISVAVEVTNLAVFQNTRALLAIRKKQVRQLEQNTWLTPVNFVLPAIIAAELILPKHHVLQAISAQLAPSLELSSPVWRVLLDLQLAHKLSLIVYHALLESTVPQAQEHLLIVLLELTATI